MERVADPSVVSALLSLVLATRNKLAVIGYSHVRPCHNTKHYFNDIYIQIVPKDPFLHPQSFCAALAAYTQSQSSSTMHASSTSLSISSPFHTPHIPYLHTPVTNSTPVLNVIGPTSHNTAPHAAPSPTPPNPTTISNTAATPTQVMVSLTLPLINSIATTFAKSRSSDSRKMHRVLLNKLDDLATDLRGGEVGGLGSDDDDGDGGGR